MSTLDINLKTINKTTIVYVIITILTYIASFIYLKLSFGVVSIFMQYIALIPLILGVIVYFILGRLKNISHSRVAYNSYNAAIATLVFGSALQGILDICGSSSDYTIYYLILGIILILIAAIAFASKQIKKTSN
ncbi:MAG: hypothetical protein IJX34_04295 [Clostridia bacterium]|nr:hypothetical protein [Clostridia bacterium]